MKSNFKLGLFAIAILAAAAAQAGVSAVGGAVDGRISVQAATYASASGNGGSLSHANTDAAAIGILNTNANGQTFGAQGQATGFVNATAYNTVFGSGSGSASAGGWSDQSVHASGSIVGLNGNVQGGFSVDGGMTNPVRNGVDAHVNAGTAQDGWATSSYNGEAVVNGTLTGSMAAITGSQVAEGQVATGAVTFTGGTPVGQSAAYRAANTGVEIDVNGTNHMVDAAAGFGF